MELDAKQQAAIEMGVDRSIRIVAVTGPAGSGKTTIIKKLDDKAKEKGMTVAICAPTGKAARRIKEATGLDAVTIHRLLEYPRPGERDEKTGEALDPGSPKRDYKNPLPYNMVIADEYAMVNYEINRNLLDALPRGGLIRVFGDKNQLPPIEKVKGKHTQKTSFVQHMERRNASVELDTVYRQGEGSGILKAANDIRKGKYFAQADDIRMTITDRPVSELEACVIKAMDNGVNFGDIENQIICTQRKRSWVGTDRLNQMLRNLLNPDGKSMMKMPRHSWDEENQVFIAENDKIIITENMYDLRDYEDRFTDFDNEGLPVPGSFIPTPENKQLLNGETGKVLRIFPDGTMEVDFGDRLVEIPSVYREYWSKFKKVIEVDPRRNIDLGFALTTHKSQGSEFNNVIYVINRHAKTVQGRQNMYTAITRARHFCRLITDQESLRFSLKKVIE